MSEMPKEIWLFGMDGHFDAATETQFTKCQVKYTRSDLSPSAEDLEMVRERAQWIEVYIANFIARPELDKLYGGAIKLSTIAGMISKWAKEALALLPTPPSRGEVVSEPAQKLYKCSVDHCGKEGPLVEPGKKADIVLIGLTPNNGFTVCEDCVKTMNWVVEQYHAGTLPGWCFLKGEPKP